MSTLKVFIIVAVILVIGGGYFLFSSRKDSSFGGSNNIIVTSSSITNGAEIPAQFTCEGEGLSPDISWENTPVQTKSLLLIMDDPDADTGVFTHWLVWNISPQTSGIAPGKSPAEAIVGKNDFGSNKYEGPCPSLGKHRYFIKIYALDQKLLLDETASIKDVETAVKKHVLDSGEIQGYYTKKLK